MPLYETGIVYSVTLLNGCTAAGGDYVGFAGWALAAVGVEYIIRSVFYFITVIFHSVWVTFVYLQDYFLSEINLFFQ